MNQNKFLRINQLKRELGEIDYFNLSDIDYPNKTLDEFCELDIKANIRKVKIDIIRQIDYVSGLNEGKPFKCFILLSDDTGKKWLDIWKVQADLPFMKGDIISISQVESDYNWHFNNWQIKISKFSLVINYRMQRLSGLEGNEDIIVIEQKINKILNKQNQNFTK